MEEREGRTYQRILHAGRDEEESKGYGIDTKHFIARKARNDDRRKEPYAADSGLIGKGHEDFEPPSVPLPSAGVGGDLRIYG